MWNSWKQSAEGKKGNLPPWMEKPLKNVPWSFATKEAWEKLYKKVPLNTRPGSPYFGQPWTAIVWVDLLLAPVLNAVKTKQFPKASFWSRASNAVKSYMKAFEDEIKQKGTDVVWNEMLDYYNQELKKKADFEPQFCTPSALNDVEAKNRTEREQAYQEASKTKKALTEQKQTVEEFEAAKKEELAKIQAPATTEGEEKEGAESASAQQEATEGEAEPEDAKADEGASDEATEGEEGKAEDAGQTEEGAGEDAGEAEEDKTEEEPSGEATDDANKENE